MTAGRTRGFAKAATLTALLHAFACAWAQPTQPTMPTTAAAAIVTLVNEADAAISQTRYDVAAAQLTEAYDLLTAANDTGLEHLVLNSLGSLYYASDQPVLAGDYYRRLITLDEQLGDDVALAISTFNMGHVAASQQQFTDADQLFRRSLTISQQLGDASGAAYAWKALGVTAQAAGQLPQAEEWLLNALAQFIELGDDIQQAAVLRNLGDVALARQLPQEALAYYQQALPLLRSAGLNSALIRTYRGLSQAFEQLNDYQNALVSQRQYDAMLQEELQQQSSNTTLQLREQLDLRRYIDDNNRLAQESAEQQELLQLQLLAMALGGSCLILLGILLWRGMRTEKILHNLATTDELTALMNRRAIFDRGRQEWQRAQRYNQPVSCLAFDVDHFKSVNDTWGHAMGDTVLKMIAATLNDMLRQTDSLGRIGGEEFLLVAANTDLAQAQAMAERIRQRVAELDVVGLNGRAITVSIGIAGYRHNLDFDQCVHRADKALYQAKNSGRNRCALYHSSMEQQALSAVRQSPHLQPV